MQRASLLIFTAALLPASLGCGPPPTIDVSGDYHETFSCQESCGLEDEETLTGELDFSLSQSGEEVSRVDADGTRWTGRLTGQVLSLATTSETYQEDSSFTIVEADDEGRVLEFAVESQYTFADCTGACTGEVLRR